MAIKRKVDYMTEKNTEQVLYIVLFAFYVYTIIAILLDDYRPLGKPMFSVFFSVITAAWFLLLILQHGDKIKSTTV
jgi:tryptophan-rich sensory protein